MWYIYILKRGIDNNIKDDKIIGILLFIVVLMQLLEYFLWKNQDCGNINQIVTILIIVLLYVQATFIYFLNDRYYSKVIKNKNIHIGLIILFSIITLIILKELIDNKNKLCSKRDNGSCRIVWGSFKYLAENKNILLILFVILYLLILFIPRLYINKDKIFYKDKPFTNNAGLVGFIIALIIAIYYKGKYFYDILGSLWCFLAVSIGLFGVLNI